MTLSTVIVGLGAMGSAAAYHLARRGHRVLGLDTYAPPHDRGSTHGGSRITRQAYYEHPDYVPLIQYAEAGWLALAKRCKQPLFQRTGGLKMSRPEGQIAWQSAATARHYALPHQWLNTDELRQLFPMFQVPDGTQALWDYTAGALDPEAIVEAHLAEARQHGAQFHFNSPMIGWEATAKGVRVHTHDASFEANHLLICTGAWTGALLADLGVKLFMDRVVQFYFRPQGGIQPYLPGKFPIFLWMTEPGWECYGLPALDGKSVKIGFYPYAEHPLRERCTPDTLRREVSKAEIEAVRAYLRPIFPSLDHELLHSAICMHTNTPDYHPIIDQHPAYPQVLMATGFSGHGFKFSYTVGELLADRVETGRSHWMRPFFRLNRFS